MLQKSYLKLLVAPLFLAAVLFFLASSSLAGLAQPAQAAPPAGSAAPFSGQLMGGQLITGSKTAALPTVIAGELLTYTLVFSTDVSGPVVITDVLDNSIDFKTLITDASHLSSTHSYKNNLLALTATNVTTGVTIPLTFTVEVSAATPNGYVITNTAYLSDTTTATQTDLMTVTVLAPILGIQKTVTPANTTLSPGAALTYTIILSNSGGAAASNIQVVDPLPPYITGTGLISTVANLPADGQKIFTLPVAVAKDTPDGVMVTNTVFYTAAHLTGQDSVGVNIVWPEIYLPIIVKPDPTLVYLSIFSENTGGTPLVQIKAGNTVVASCTNLPNNQTVGCDTFPAGTYTIVAQTNRCGTVQGTLTYAAGSRVTTVFCD